MSKLSNPEPERSYGTDETEKFDTLAEATWQTDGTLHIEIVQLDKH